MWRAAVAYALLAVLAAPSAADSNQTACETLHSYALLNSYLRAIGDRSVSVDGLEVSVTLYWGSGPARAAAALLRAQLTHVHRYRRVRLRRGPLSTAALAAHVPFHSDANYTDLVIGLSTAWSPESAPPWAPLAGRKSSLAGPRLSEFGASPVPAHCRLFAGLPAAARRQPRCAGLSRHLTRADLAALAHCGFKHQSNGSAFELFVVDECNSTRLRACALDYGTTFSPKAMSRTDLYHKLNATTNNTESFFFLDFDIWEGEETVSALNVPCREQEVDIRIGDVAMLQTYAPQLFRFIYNFKPSATSLRQILEREANGDNIDEAACAWVIENETYKIDTSTLMDYDASGYVVVIFVCNDDSFKDRYRYELFPFLGKHIKKEMYKVTSYVTFRRYTINCTSEDDMSAHFEMLTTTVELYRLLGVVSMSVEGAQKASALAAPRHVPLMLADVAPEFGGNTTWRVAARVLHVASALTHFVRSSGWARLAVLTQPTKLAADYWDALRHNTTITFGHFQLPLRITRHKAKETIDSLQAANARIVFINADSKSAEVILAVADENGMTYHNGFVWIVRDWRPTTDTNTSCHEARRTTHFVLSLWIRDSRDIPSREGNALQEHLRAKFKDRPWPPHAVSIANAFLTLTIGFKNVFKQNPSTRYDLHNKQVTRLLHNKIIENPALGVNQHLHFKNRSIEETAVFADQWCGAQFQQRLGRWRVNASSGAVRGNYTPPGDLPRHDGASRCMVSSGDAFDPACYDAACASALLLSLLACGALLLTRRVLLRRLERERHEQQIQAVARRQHVAAVLAAYLVERDALELREELGAGRFGSVRLARLHTSTHGTRYIAAKALRANAAPAEESEFLREACTIASLDHAHIVRLVGVCIADGPPLVLMELAFFGDLLGYLRARRHLVEGAGTEAPPASGEAEHVSAGALTRLAREAAEALRYLSARGVVHRDVRAANCLVDVRRSLKLADFGMARDTVAGADGAPEYACRRRGLFPVLWMAPESLAHGVFSAASDVWAFGVLLLELVTLGARPYGSMSPLCVLEYVAGGGSPPLPLDASPQMRGLARLCWQRAAERRPAAAELAAYLAAWPRALRPALLSERDEPADADSGIGDSPSTELLPPDSPLLSLDQLDVLGVTH